jgi:polysaccharide export outer membrane protein
MTLQQIQAVVEKALMPSYYPADKISVVATISEQREQSVTVQGQVPQPGEKRLRGNQMTVSRAISEAGGFTSMAGEEIEVRRTVDGKSITIAVTKTQLQNGEDPALIADDTVTVKQGYVFFVNGEVNSPGQKAWAPGMTVLRAVGLANGMTPKGKYGHIQRAKKDADGNVIGYEKIKDLKDATLVLPDDVLQIDRKWWGD